MHRHRIVEKLVCRIEDRLRVERPVHFEAGPQDGILQPDVATRFPQQLDVDLGADRAGVCDAFVVGQRIATEVHDARTPAQLRPVGGKADAAGDIGAHEVDHVLRGTGDLGRLLARAVALVGRMEDHLDAVQHHHARDLGNGDLATCDHREAAKLGIHDGERALPSVTVQIGVHHVVRGRPHRRIDAPVAQHDIATRIDEEACVEIASGPLGRRLELVAGDVDAELPGQRLERLGDAPGHRRARLVDPLSHRTAVGRALHAEFGQNDEPRRVRPGARRLDHGDAARNIAFDHAPGRIPVGSLRGKLAAHLDAGCPPGRDCHLSLLPQITSARPGSRSGRDGYSSMPRRLRERR